MVDSYLEKTTHLLNASSMPEFELRTSNLIIKRNQKPPFLIEHMFCGGWDTIRENK